MTTFFLFLVLNSHFTLSPGFYYSFCLLIIFLCLFFYFLSSSSPFWHIFFIFFLLLLYIYFNLLFLFIILIRRMNFFNIHGFLFAYFELWLFFFFMNSCRHLIRFLGIFCKEYLEDLKLFKLTHGMSVETNEFFKIIIILFIGSSIQVDPIVPTHSKRVFAYDKIRRVRISKRYQNISFILWLITVSDRKLFIYQVGFNVYIQTEDKRTHRIIDFKFLASFLRNCTWTISAIGFIKLISDNVKQIRFVITQLMKTWW